MTLYYVSQRDSTPPGRRGNRPVPEEPIRDEATLRQVVQREQAARPSADIQGHIAEVIIRPLS